MKVLIIDKCAGLKESFACAFESLPAPADLTLMSAQTLGQAKKKLAKNPGIDIIVWGTMPTLNEDEKLLPLIQGYSKNQGKFPPRIISANSLGGQFLHQQALIADCTLICERNDAPKIVRRFMNSPNPICHLLAI
jgi:hypothetical protein